MVEGDPIERRLSRHIEVERTLLTLGVVSLSLCALMTMTIDYRWFLLL
jgi:hypothetical protein